MPRDGRKTRNSVVPGDLVPPYNVERYVNLNSQLTHAAVRFEGGSYVLTCCKAQLNPPNPDNVFGLDTVVTCLLCVLCRGCPACVSDYISEETMKLGKWVTKDNRKLYPFEMDNTHLANAVNKLLRDEKHFKDNWLEWLDVLRAEGRKRGFS